MTVLERAPFLPFMDPRLSRPPGLQPLDPAEWFLIHPDYPSQIAYRDRLIAEERAAVLALLPEGREAAEELLETVVARVLTLPGFSREGDIVTRPDGGLVAIDRADPLATAGRLVADDLCLLLPDPDSGEYRLVGAVLCFPSRWLLADKLGRPMTTIHEPVPVYDADLARRVNRVFEALKPERPVWRVNWIVYPTPELFLPVSHAGKSGPLPAEDGQLYLRTERQTLLRLPRTGAVVFGIKNSVSPVDSLMPAEAAALREAMLGYSPATIAYKAGGIDYGRALDRLAEIACQKVADAPSCAVN